jgi:hypothetical protein
MLVRRLEDAALGEATDVEPHHVTAALGLLKFCLPTMSSTDHTTGGEPFTIDRIMFNSGGK